jgi:hypothetical protein
MILQAFVEGRQQCFYVNNQDIYNKTKFISKAIKNPIIIYEVKRKDLDSLYYRYDFNTQTYKSIKKEEIDGYFD